MWCGMAGFFTSNIERRGRLVRLIGGVALIAGAAAAWFVSGWLSGALLVAGAFVLYEAARGWCLLRACGIRTRL